VRRHHLVRVEVIGLSMTTCAHVLRLESLVFIVVEVLAMVECHHQDRPLEF
jgi:hypothetical protein